MAEDPIAAPTVFHPVQADRAPRSMPDFVTLRA